MCETVYHDLMYLSEKPEAAPFPTRGDWMGQTSCIYVREALPDSGALRPRAISTWGQRVLYRASWAVLAAAAMPPSPTSCGSLETRPNAL